MILYLRTEPLCNILTLPNGILTYLYILLKKGDGMNLDYQKELVPHIVNISGLKILTPEFLVPNEVCIIMHWHEQMELILVTEGTLYLQVGNENCTLTKDQLAIIPPKVAHYGVAGNKGTLYKTIIFDPTRLYNRLGITELFLKPLAEYRSSFQPWTDQPDIIALMHSLFVMPEDNFAALSLTAKLYELLALLYKYCSREEQSTDISKSKQQHILDYIDQHYCEDISSASICRHFGYSEAYFCRLFKKTTGLTPMNYIRILRLEKAASLIIKQKDSIHIIAEKCGFTSISYFNESFKAQYRMTPKEYQEKHLTQSQTTE